MNKTFKYIVLLALIKCPGLLNKCPAGTQPGLLADWPRN